MEYEIYVYDDGDDYDIRSWTLTMIFPYGPVRSIHIVEPYTLDENDINNFIHNKKITLKGWDNGFWYLDHKDDCICKLYVGTDGNLSVNMELPCNDVYNMLNIIKNVNNCLKNDIRYDPQNDLNIRINYENGGLLTKKAK